MNLFDDSESDGEANDHDDDVAFTNDNHSSDCSGSVWSCGSDGDELMHDEDEPLIYESNVYFSSLVRKKWSALGLGSIALRLLPAREVPVRQIIISL
eukprot:scaffold5112_cov127-Skeletonema_dohrnii-CCMP3373.AAC.1